MMKTSTVTCTCGRLLRFKLGDTKYYVCPACDRFHWRYELEPSSAAVTSRCLSIQEKLSLDKSYMIDNHTLTIVGLEQYECTNGFYSLWLAHDALGEVHFVLEAGDEIMLMVNEYPPIDMQVFQGLYGGAEFKLDEELWIVSEVDRVVTQRMAGEVINDLRGSKAAFIIHGSGKGKKVLWVLVNDSKHCKVYKGEYKLLNQGAK